MGRRFRTLGLRRQDGFPFADNFASGAKRFMNGVPRMCTRRFYLSIMYICVYFYVELSTAANVPIVARQLSFSHKKSPLAVVPTAGANSMC